MFAGGVTGQGSYSEGLIDKIDVIFELMKCMYQIRLIVILYKKAWDHGGIRGEMQNPERLFFVVKVS